MQSVEGTLQIFHCRILKPSHQTTAVVSPLLEGLLHGIESLMCGAFLPCQMVWTYLDAKKTVVIQARVHLHGHLAQAVRLTDVLMLCEWAGP